MPYLFGLGAALAGLWFALSGQTDFLFLFFGALSVVLSMWIAARLEIIDRDASPYHRLPILAMYNGWLGLEIIKSNWQVIKSVFDPHGGVDPGQVDLRLSCRSDLSKSMFANSITLTPGTVTVDIHKDVLTVHALHKSNAIPEAFAEMERRAARAADGPIEGAISSDRRLGDRRRDDRRSEGEER